MNLKEFKNKTTLSDLILTDQKGFSPEVLTQCYNEKVAVLWEVA